MCAGPAMRFSWSALIWTAAGAVVSLSAQLRACSNPWCQSSTAHRVSDNAVPTACSPSTQARQACLEMSLFAGSQAPAIDAAMASAQAVRALRAAYLWQPPCHRRDAWGVRYVA